MAGRKKVGWVEARAGPGLRKSLQIQQIRTRIAQVGLRGERRSPWITETSENQHFRDFQDRNWAVKLAHGRPNAGSPPIWTGFARSTIARCRGTGKGRIVWIAGPDRPRSPDGPGRAARALWGGAGEGRSGENR